MTPDQQAALEQMAREYLEWLRGTKPSNTYVTQIAVDRLIALLAAQRAAVLEEEAKFWDQAAECPCKDGDDFAWANRLSARFYRLAREQRP